MSTERIGKNGFVQTNENCPIRKMLIAGESYTWADFVESRKKKLAKKK